MKREDGGHDAGVLAFENARVFDADEDSGGLGLVYMLDAVRSPCSEVCAALSRSGECVQHLAKGFVLSSTC